MFTGRRALARRTFSGFKRDCDGLPGNTAKADTYTPLFMVLAGRITAPVTSGFGAESAAAFYATQLVRVPSKGSCAN